MVEKRDFYDFVHLFGIFAVNCEKNRNDMENTFPEIANYSITILDLQEIEEFSRKSGYESTAYHFNVSLLAILVKNFQYLKFIT